MTNNENFEDKEKNSLVLLMEGKEKELHNQCPEIINQANISDTFNLKNCNLEKNETSIIIKATYESYLKEIKKSQECSLCHRQFTKKVRLNVHMRTHTGFKPFKCTYEECGKRFNEKGNLKTHLRIHTGEKPYICKVEGCGKVFTTQGHLTDHSRQHTGERPYICKICGNSFSRSSTLKIHLRIHSGEKPYMCPYQDCKKAFTEGGNLKSHIKTKHKKVIPNFKQNKEKEKEKEKGKEKQILIEKDSSEKLKNSHFEKHPIGEENAELKLKLPLIENLERCQDLDSEYLNEIQNDCRRQLDSQIFYPFSSRNSIVGNRGELTWRGLNENISFMTISEKTSNLTTINYNVSPFNHTNSIPCSFQGNIIFPII